VIWVDEICFVEAGLWCRVGYSGLVREENILDGLESLDSVEGIGEGFTNNLEFAIP
jgi:hypothetical protein